MRLSKICVPSLRLLDTGRPSWRIVAAIAMSAGLAACASNTPKIGQLGAVTGFIGGAVGDEPLAVSAARDVLSSGGTAADAAVALYFTMTLSKPSVAGIGGGGVCVVNDAKKKKAEVLDFWPRTGTPGANSTTATTIPGVPRGLYALSARYGRLPWSQVIAAAEQDARFGAPLSRSLEMDLKAAESKVANTPMLSSVYMDNGKIKNVGDKIQNVKLSALLSALRIKGPGDFYTGKLAREIVQSVQAAGGTLTLDDMRNYKPVWHAPTKVKLGNEDVYFSHAPKSAAGTGAIADDSALAGLLNRYLADIGAEESGGMQENGRSGFVVVDKEANAVACETTMNTLFGSGIGAPSYGLVLANGDHSKTTAPLVGPVLIANPFVGEYHYGIAGSGSPAGATKQIALMANDLLGAGTADHVAPSDVGKASVNRIACLDGIPPHPETCRFEADPAGGGMAANQ